MTPKYQQAVVRKILELSANPTRGEIDRNYRRLVKQYHPDVNKDPNAEAAMKLINQAYAIAIAIGKRSYHSNYPHHNSLG